jgi:enoyl-CoA hydratase
MEASLKSTYQPNGVLQLTLNRPHALNALNEKLLQELVQAFTQAKYDNKIKAVLLHGEGKAFCAGADITQLAELNANTGYSFAKSGQSVFNALENLGKPSLAAIHGFALGGGCELAMAASLRLAAENAVFGQPEIKLGIIPGFGGTQRLTRLVGKGRALDLCLTGRLIKSPEALQIGLINEMTTEDSLLKRANELLEILIALPAHAAKSLLETIHQGYDLTLASALELEATHFGLCCATTDKQEGVNAFLEKRATQFTGK